MKEAERRESLRSIVPVTKLNEMAQAEAARLEKDDAAESSTKKVEVLDETWLEMGPKRRTVEARHVRRPPCAPPHTAGQGS